MGRFGHDDPGRPVPECPRLSFTHKPRILNNVLSTVGKQCWNSFCGGRGPYVEHRDTKNVVVAEVIYVRENISDRKAEASNGHIAGNARFPRLNEEIILL